MTIDEFLNIILETLYAAFISIGDIIRCAADILSNKKPKNSEILPENAIKLFSNAALNKTVFFVIIAYILFINIFTYTRYGSDKKRAKRKERRISEANLIRLCFLGGAIGGMVGMNVFHHKTQKKKFVITVSILFIVQLIFYCFVLGFLGFWAFF